MATQEKLKTKKEKSTIFKDVKKIDWDKYFGKIHFPEDGLTYQKKIRNEWGR